MKHVVVTGVTSGIGRATAAHLAARGYHVFGSTRSPDGAAALQATLGKRFTPLALDLTDTPAVGAAAAQVAEALGGQGLFALVNNAGHGSGGPLMHQPLAEVRQMFETTVLGTLAVTQAFLPLLGACLPQAHQPGRIVNVSSVRGRIALPLLGAYSASRHALEAVSDTLRRELAIYGIDVIVIQPGTVATPMWDKVEQHNPAARYAHTDYGPAAARLQRAVVARGRRGTPPEKVARVIREALENARPRTRYPIVRSWLAGWVLPRLLPDRWVDRMLAARLGLRRK